MRPPGEEADLKGLPPHPFRFGWSPLSRMFPLHSCSSEPFRASRFVAPKVHRLQSTVIVPSGSDRDDVVGRRAHWMRSLETLIDG